MKLSMVKRLDTRTGANTLGLWAIDNTVFLDLAGDVLVKVFLELRDDRHVGESDILETTQGDRKTVDLLSERLPYGIDNLVLEGDRLSVRVTGGYQIDEILGWDLETVGRHTLTLLRRLFEEVTGVKPA